MASKVEICSNALQNVGKNPITSLTEDTTEARECNLRYDTARRTLLSMHPWNFAIKRASLNLDVAAPAFGYPYQFTLPSDFLGIVMTGTEEDLQGPNASPLNSALYVDGVTNFSSADKYRIEGDKLLSYDEAVNIIYIADIEDTQKFSAIFTELFQQFLAVKICYRITGSTAERNAQLQIFQADFLDFQSIDSQQGVFDRISTSEFIASRM